MLFPDVGLCSIGVPASFRLGVGVVRMGSRFGFNPNYGE